MGAQGVPASRFSFQKSGKFLKEKASAGIDIDAAANPAVALAIERDLEFPQGTIRLGTLAAKASAGTGAIQFGGDQKGTVSFSAGGGLRAGLGVYTDSSVMFADLGGDANLLDGASFNDTGVHRYVALYWGYDIKAAAKGSVALGTGALAKFGVDAASEGVFAFVRAHSGEPKARTAIADVIQGWCLPRQIKDDASLAPGTWAIAEVDGQFAATLGAQYGYNFNWIRKVGLQGLSGDIGLKIQAGVEVQLGFSASGKYLVIVGRDSLNPAEKVIRVRLHKMSKKGLSCALNASLGVKGTTGKLLPQQLDALIAGMFGIAAPQVVSDLKILRTIADPSIPLNKLAGDFLVDFGQKELSKIVDLKARFDEAKGRIVHFLDVWDGLGAKASSIMWNAVAKGDSSFAEIIKLLAAPGADLKKILTTELSKVDFFRTPIGQLLEAQASTTILAMLDNSSELARIRDIAAKIKAVLDGNVLTHLTRYVDDRLGLDKIRKLTLDDLDKRLREKLSDFLEKPLDAAGLKEIRNAIDEIFNKADKLYSEARKALNKTYTFELHAAYQKTTTRDALIDASFDFNENPDLAAALAAAIDGDFQKLLADGGPGVTINAATMTHGVIRQADVSFNMPYYSSSSAGLNQALASLDVKAEEEGLYMFNLKASDRQTTTLNNRNRWSSRLALGMKLGAAAGSGIRDYDDPLKLGGEMAVTYGFRRATAGMTTAALLHQLTPLQQAFLPGQFGIPGKPSLLSWVTDLDKLFDVVENNGTGRLGNTLVSLDLSLPGNVLAGWLNAPAKDRDPAYLALSIAVQTALKRLIPYCYFQDLRRYEGAQFPAAAVLAYAAIPPSNSLHLGNDGLAVPDSHPSCYWDVFDVNLVKPMLLRDPRTVQSLAVAMAGIRTLLSATDGLQGEAQFYEPSEIGRILKEACSGPGLHLLQHSLLFTEAEVLKSAVEAGQALARFRKASADKPAAALENLADFGHHLTEAFNGKLSDLFNAPDEPDLLRNFGLLVFVEASRVLHDGLGAVQTTAALDVAILRGTNDQGKPVAFPPEGFPDNDPVPGENLGVQQRILSVA